MLTFLIGIALGVVFGGALVLLFVRERARLGGIRPTIERLILAEKATDSTPQPLSKEVVNDLKRDSPELLEVIQATPAVPVESLPAEVKQSVLGQIRQAKEGEAAQHVARGLIRNTDVADVFAALSNWAPRRHFTEEKYQSSLRAHLTRSGYQGRIVEKPALPWCVGEDDKARTAKPDFILGAPDGPPSRRILLELKADLYTSADTDRALGQMLRYLLAWKKQGPAILLIGGDASPELASLIRLYINTWREQLRLPVTVHFMRADEVPSDDEALMLTAAQE